LDDIGAGGIPRIFIFNKADRLEEEKSSRVSIPILTEEDGRITMSAKSEADLALLVKTIEEKINENRRECTLLIPYAEGALLSRLKKDADMQVLNYLEGGTLVKAVLKEEDYGKLREYFHDLS
jgi:GTP-binding protein HflX